VGMLILEDKCVNCDICRIVCPNNNIRNDNRSADTVFAVKHKDDQIRLNSSSGGFFSAISDLIIEQSGIVYGARFDQKFHIVHSRAVNKKQRDCFRGSKYVQSDIGNAFINVKEDLKKGHLVLFTGAPCQVAGLNSYLKKEYENLITCDFICHGVPSPGFWNDYIRHLQLKYKSKLSHFSFRDKSRGWEKAFVKKKFSNGKVFLDSILTEPFGSLFCSNLILRESCYSCRYANTNRPSDITIGDFWAINKVDSSFNDGMGISQVLNNTKKGYYYFNLIKVNLSYCTFNIKVSLQPNLISPTERNRKSTQFWNDYNAHGIEYCLIKYKLRYQKLRSILQKVGLLNFLKRIIRN